MEPHKEQHQDSNQEQNYERGAIIINLAPHKNDATQSTEIQDAPTQKPPKPGWFKFRRKATTPMGLYTLGLLIATTFQGWIIREQLREMHSQSVAMRETLNEMRKQTQPMIDAAKAARDSVDDNRISREESLKPRIFAWQAEFHRPLTKGSPLIATIELISNGESTALRFKGHFHATFGKCAKSQVGKIGKMPPPGSHFDFVEGQSQPFLVSTLSNPDDQYSKPIPWDGTFPIYVFGEFEYWDQFGWKYTGTFCREYSEEMRTFGACPFYNNSPTRVGQQPQNRKQ
jgi:hypothetical protein